MTPVWKQVAEAENAAVVEEAEAALQALPRRLKGDAMALWSGRFTENVSEFTQRFGASLPVDKRCMRRT